VADRLNDQALDFWATWSEGWAALAAGDLARYANRDDAAARLAGDLGQPVLQWINGFCRPNRLRLAGKFDESEAEAMNVLELGRSAGITDAFRFYGAAWFRVAYDRGCLGDLDDSLTRAVHRSERDAITLAAFALMLCEVGRTGEARETFDRIAEEGFDSIPSNFMWLYTMTMLAEVCAHVGDTERAALLYDHLTPFAGVVAHIASAASGNVAHYLGLLATTLARFDEADTHFARAEGVHDQMATPALLARTRLEWARMLSHAAGGPRDTERARELLRRAVAAARELGMAKVERDATALLE